MSAWGLGGDRGRGPADHSGRDNNLSYRPEWLEGWPDSVPEVFGLLDKLGLPLAFDFRHTDRFLTFELGSRVKDSGAAVHFVL